MQLLLQPTVLAATAIQHSSSRNNVLSPRLSNFTHRSLRISSQKTSTSSIRPIDFPDISMLLVYEFLPNGSSDSHLFNEKSSLTWKTRYKVAQGLASALVYLHEEWEQCVVFRDIKSSYIMLDSSFNAKLGDFGLATFVDHEKESQATVLASTMGCKAPACVITGKASKESNVYSFGIVALETASGRKSTDVRAQGNQVWMVEWVWKLYGRGLPLEEADPKLFRDYNEQEMERLMVVSLWCAHPDIVSAYQ